MRWLVLALTLLATPAWAAYPTVVGTNSSSDSAAGLTHAINLPASVAAGNLLIAVATCRAYTTGATSWTAGWTEFFNKDSGTDGTYDIKAVAAYKVAAGGETAVTLTTANSRSCAGVTYRISGQGAGAPAVSTGVVYSASGGTTTGAPDPDSLTSGFGAVETLWIAGAGFCCAVTVSGYPASYTDGLQIKTSGTAAVVSMSAAQRNNAVATEDPGAFTLTDVGNTAIAVTIAVRPAVTARVIGGGLGPGMID